MLNLDINYTWLVNVLWTDAYYELRLGAQYSPDALTLQDQFSVGDRWNVRGFENSAGLYSDKGIYSQNTLNFITGFSNLEWYLGTDFGATFKGNNKRDGIDYQQLLGATVGLKGSIKALGYDVSLSKPLLYPQSVNADKVNFNLNISYQF